MFTNFKSKTSKIMAFILAACMLLSMIPVSLITVFAATTDYPDSFTVSVKDTQGNPVEGANVQLVNGDTKWSIRLIAQTDASGIAVFDSNEIKTAFEAGVAAGTITSESVLGNVGANKSGYESGSNKLVRFYADAGYTEHVELTMTPPISDVEIAGKNLTYNGEAQELVSVTKVEGDTIEYYLNGATDPVTEVPTAIEAGTYSVRVVVTRTNYLTLDKTVETKINLADIEGIDIAPVTGLKYNGQEQALVTLTGSFATGDTVTWTVNGEETNSSEVPKADAIGNYKVKLTVVRNDNYKTFEKEVDVAIDTGVLNIENLEVKANDRTYDGSTKDALTVKNQGDYNLEYKLGENGTWTTDTIPQITDAGTYKVYVKATKTGYHDAEYPTYPITVTIAQAKITGVTATGYSAKYDKQSHDAITKVEGVLDGDTVTYAKTEDGTYTSEIPSVKRVKDSGTYFVKVYRNDNYETLIIPVTVAITKNDQQTLSFAETLDRIYNDNTNTFKYEATTNATDAEGTITYEKVGGTANFNVTTDGTVTYTSVGTIKVKATISSCDNYESATVTYEITVSYPTTPDWTITGKDATVGNCNWYKGDVVIKADGWEIIKDSNALDQTSWSQEIVESTEKDYPNYKVAFRNAAGDITDLVDVSYFAIDKTKPTEKNPVSVQFKDKNADTISKVINFLTFGLFCNEEVEVTVTCDDEALTAGSPNAGIASIQLFKYDMNGTPTEVALDTGKTNVFTLPVGFEGTIKVKITDKVGNTLGEQLITKDNSNMENVNGYVMIEEVAPTLSELKDEALDGVRNDEGTHNYSGDIKITFDAQDTGSGLYSVTVKLNGEGYPVTPSTFAAQDREKHSYELSTVGKTPDENGKFKFEVTVVDNAGNVTTDALTVEKDLTSPIITGFDFAVGTGKVDVQDVVSIEDYGYYFREKVTVTISAKDEKFDPQDHELVSGVEKITVVLVDKDGKYYTVNEQKVVTEIADITGAYTHVVSNNVFEFDISQNFKGQIYAYATDNVGNMPTNSTFDFGAADDNIVDDGVLKGYKHPAGSVLESQNKHDTADYDHITFEKAETTLKTNDESNNELYAENVDVKLTVTDNYSGISKIEWSVVAPYDTTNNQEGTVTIKNNEDVAVNGVIGGWKVLTKDNNLVTKVEQTITVKNDSNNIVVWVKLTDRAGNTTVDEIKFNIDKQAPIMSVEMNDNDDEKYNGFFKEDRTYKVTILERNFIKDVKFVVTVTDDNDVKSDVNVAPDFKVVMDGDKPKATIIDGIEYYTYEWDSKFATDGDYTFSVSAIDLANNETVDSNVSYVNGEDEDIRTISNAFTVDKTLPIISVSYDNNTAQNGKYFAKARIATIVVKEHNFDVERVDFSALTASLDKNDIAKPEIKWEHDGNTHTATISFAVDGDYTFDVKMTDKAANESKDADYGNSVAGKEFVVDLTAPKLDITGVADKSANNGEVAPVITYSDVNFNKDAVSIVLSGINNGKVNYNGTYTDAEHGQTYTYANFEKVQKVDDIYTLTAKLTDMAGNETEKTITFSANRFGSVYDLTNVKDIISKYLQNEKDIVFTETNVDSLEREGIKIKLTKNGTPTDLVEGTDYTVDVTGGNGQWSVYKYTVNKKLFADDGRYSISIYSKDAAGNVNENIDETKEAEISFGIDKTKPVIVPIDFESDVQYAVDVKTVSVEIKDNLVLEGVKIYLNGEEIEYKVDGEIYTFDIPKSNSKQDVKIVAVDAAGNEQPIEVNDFLVNTNIFVRWYNNTPLFVGSIIGVVVLALGITIFLVFFKKKKEDEDK